MLHTILFDRKATLVACLLVFIFSIFSPSVSQELLGQPKVTNYNYLEYESDYAINWIIEGDDGLMYFANYEGVLVYDGVTWKKIKSDSAVKALVKDSEGLIYYTTSTDLGYIGHDNKGRLNLISLKDEIPEAHLNFNLLWDVLYFEGKIFFFDEQRLFVWDGERMEVIPFNNAYHITAIANNKLYVRFWDKGLCVWENGEFKLVPGGERFANERVYAILPYKEEKILLGVRDLGFFIYDGNTIEPFETEIDEIAKRDITFPGLALKDGNFLINTNASGGYLIDKEGQLLQKFSLDTGLEGSSVTFSYQDSRNVLWLTNDKGLSAVDLTSPFTYLGSDIGEVQKIKRFNGTLYFTTTEGIFFIDKESGQIEKVKNVSGSIGNIVSINNHLFAAGTLNGLLEVKNDEIVYVRENVNFDYRIGQIYKSFDDPNRLFVHIKGALDSYYYNEQEQKLQWESQFKFPENWIGVLKSKFSDKFWGFSGDESELYGLLIEKNPNGPINLEKSKINHFELPFEPRYILEFFGKDYYVDKNNVIYSFNEDKGDFTETEPFFGNNIGRLRSSDGTMDSEGKVFYFMEDGIKVAEKISDDSISVNSETFRHLNNLLITNIYPEDPDENGNQIVWFGGGDGIVRYEGRLDKPETTNFDVQIRGITASNDSLIYSGAGKLPEDLIFKANDNTVVFNYAAPVFSNQKNVTYSTKLDGLDNKWSEWTKQTSREYLNLGSGNYNFKVKAKNIYGDESEEASFNFSIATPWYATWWAYLIFALVGVLIIYAIIRQRTKLLRDRQDELEQNVEERTQEVQKRMNELATVNHVSQALTEKLKLNELIDLVGEEMKKLFNSDITYLALIDKENNVINFPYQDGDNIAPQKFGKGLTSKIITTGEPLLINKDADIDAEYKKIGVEQSGKPAISYLGVPIPSEDNIIGVLSVQSTQHESRFSEEDKRLLSTIAINVGIAIHNAELYEQARLAKLKAEEANEAKSTFLSTVSHELRTPLTSVLGFAKIIRKRLEDKIFPAVNIEDQKIKRTMKQVNENLNVVISEGERLTTLINDVLDLAKIESGKMEWNMRPTFLQDSINRAIASTQSLFDQKGLKLNKKIPSDLPLVNADEDKIIQVVINLISNAVKFTDSGKVEIEAYQDKDQIIVEVKDTGIGIADEDHYKVFEKFRQAGDTLTDKPKGTGLGLPICREIVEHHGGIIWMTSEPAVGSTFYFSLPLLSQTAEPKPVQLDRILTSLKKQIKHTAKNANSKKPPTILVVDDATPIRSLLRQELTEAGYLVQEAADGKMALDMVRYSKPDLIILDVMMPEINGFDVAAVLKNDPSTMDIPIIILSIVQDKERGLRIGVDRYLTKPINTDQLFHEVDVLLEQGVSKKKVLVVDEDTSAVNSLSEVLTARGYKVMNSNGSNIFESAKESQPDIIMLNSVYNGDQELIKDIKLQKGMENVMFFIYE